MSSLMTQVLLLMKPSGASRGKSLDLAEKQTENPPSLGCLAPMRQCRAGVLANVASMRLLGKQRICGIAWTALTASELTYAALRRTCILASGIINELRQVTTLSPRLKTQPRPVLRRVQV